MTATTTNPTVTLSRAIRAKYPIICLASQEEARVEASVKALADKQGKLLFVWTSALGLRQTTGETVGNAPEPSETRDPGAVLATIYRASEFCGESRAIFLLKDLHGFIEGDPTITRWLRDIVAKNLESGAYNLILLSPNFNIPGEIEKETLLIDWPLPNDAELKQIVLDAKKHLPENVPDKLTKSDIEKVVRAMRGLTALEASNVISMAIVANKALDNSAIKIIIDEKRGIVRKSGYLEFFDADVSYADIGGAAKLKEYNQQVRAAFGEEAEAFGLTKPRGVLLVGVPGAGKSLMAKAATMGEVPLLRLDIGSLMGGLVGQSEGNARAALKLAEALGNCVLWIDEIDKGMAGMGGGESDGGTSRRVLGTILTWMQEHQSGVYVFATANDMSYIVNRMPELIRRFDDVWWVDLPNTQERAEIAAIHLSKRNRKPGAFDLVAISAATKEFTGAEIEKVIASALRACFARKAELTTSDIINAARATVPISRTMGDNLKALRAWARTSARWSSEPEDQVSVVAGRKLELEGE